MTKLLILIVAFSSFNSTAFASEDKLTIPFLTKKAVRQIVGDYPAHGSAEEAYDYEVLLNYQETRTQAECDEAAAEKTPTLTSMFAGEHGPITKKEARRIAPRFWRAYIVVGLNISIAKKTFKRPRPFNANPDIVPCIPLATSEAYPSGHTTIARVFALKLAEIFPERANEIMQRGDEVAMNRIIGGVHHPSDIVAGKKLGDAIFAMLQED